MPDNKISKAVEIQTRVVVDLLIKCITEGTCPSGLRIEQTRPILHGENGMNFHQYIVMYTVNNADYRLRVTFEKFPGDAVTIDTLSNINITYMNNG